MIWHKDKRIVEAEVSVAHVRRNKKLIRTVASIRVDDKVHVGVAGCNPSDNFSRRLGKDISIGRARFAMAIDLGITDRKGQKSLYGTMRTVPADEFIALAKSFGVNIPEETLLAKSVTDLPQPEPTEVAETESE